jgi:D-alanyl-D-alanine carboxypeptidase/D-alanyl-D-alanine-endopeptidase (penicillin-binding protein 4)
VITALAALLQLGPDFRFTTTLETKGNVDGGVLKGDLIARFGGDPTFKRQDIRNMVAVLKNRRAENRWQCADRHLHLCQPR